MKYITTLSIALLIVLLHAPDFNHNAGALEQSDQNFVTWKEPKISSPEELGVAANRLEERPGNYRILETIHDFIEGVQALRPELHEVCFPMQFDSKTYESMDAWEEWLERQEEQAEGVPGKPRNKLRQYNILIRNMEMVRIDRGADKILSDHLDEYDTKKLVSARKAHPERGYIVFLSVAYESLQSPKVEGGDKPNMRFLVVEKDEGWKIAWFDK